MGTSRLSFQWRFWGNCRQQGEEGEETNSRPGPSRGTGKEVLGVWEERVRFDERKEDVAGSSLSS